MDQIKVKSPMCAEYLFHFTDNSNLQLITTVKFRFLEAWISLTSRLLEPRVISLPSVEQCYFPPDFSNYPIFKPICISLRGSKKWDSSVFQSYSYRSSAPHVIIGCISIVVAFFLLVTGGILVTVYKHKNEQKGKFYI